MRATSFRHVFALVFATAAMSVPVAVASAPAAHAALPPVTGCGFTLGPITEQGAAGTEIFLVTLRPVNPAQRCTIAVPFTASITANGAAYRNIQHNPLTATETVTFVPARRAPTLAIGWGAHCADPAGPGTFRVTTSGQTFTTAIAASSCTGVAASSALESLPTSNDSVVGIAPTPSNNGYRTVDEVGFITAKGDATSFVEPVTSAPVVAIVGAPAGQGAWLASADGGVFSFGTAAFHGSLGGHHLNAPIVGMAAAPGGTGYWLVAADGGIFSFGTAAFHGSLGAMHLNAPVVGMAAAPDGGGYWLVAADGGVFAFGSAKFHGSMGAVLLHAPIAGIAAKSDGGGYWFVATDGGIFSFGTATFHGSLGAMHLNQPISGMAATASGNGYWLVGSDNGVFTFGDAHFFGSSPAP